MCLLRYCVVFSALTALCRAGWMQNLQSPDGYPIGDGVVLHLVENQDRKNASLLDKYALRIDYGDYGLGLAKGPKDSSVEMKIVAKSPVEEARKRRRHSTNIMHVVFGFQMAMLVTMGLAAVGGLVFKALTIAKISAVMAFVILITKLFGQHQSHQQSLELEHVPEPPAVHPEGGDFQSSGSANYYGYSNYIPSRDYPTMDGGIGNSTYSTNQGVAPARRRELIVRRKNKIPIVTIHKFS